MAYSFVMVVVGEDLVLAATQLAGCYCASHFARAELVLICNTAEVMMEPVPVTQDETLNLTHSHMTCSSTLRWDAELSKKLCDKLSVGEVGCR